MGIFINGREITGTENAEDLAEAGITIEGSIIGGSHYGIAGGQVGDDSVVLGDDE
ncbi:hypothetical protein ABZ569_33470 [Streptomyces albus]|uniref:hypothetical protein n=1 Tax=Streptomyces albus TaxID=1888 RepID=UPI0033CA78E0